MRSHKGLMLALATLAATATVSLAQDANPAPQDSAQMSSQTNNAPMQAQPAPIERTDVTPYTYNTYIAKVGAGQVIAPKRGIASALPARGVYLRVGDGSSVRAVTVTDENIDLRVERGIANISVHNPVSHAQIIVDLPGGQTDLVKDGFYTFNADTNTIRVLKGEAFAYPGTSPNTNQKPIKVKENHAVVFSGPNVKPFEFDPFEGRADLIPYTPRSGGGYDEADGRNYGGGPYYGDPYYGYGYPWAFDPWAFDLGFWGGWGWGGGYGGYGGGHGGWGGGGGHGGGGGGHGGGGGGHGGGGGGHH
jgi:uncharacterized membrane protein YgcG